LKLTAYKNAASMAVPGARYRIAPAAQDPLWPPPARAYGGVEKPEQLRRGLMALGIAVLQLTVPVALLLVLLAATWLYADDVFTGLPVAIQGMGLAVSDIILPGAWTCIHLVNRRHGPGHAFAQLLAGLALAASVLLFNLPVFGNWATLPSWADRAVLSFGLTFLAANFVAIAFFDAARGRHWWSAPLAGSFAASFVFSGIYFPAAFAGQDPNWTLSAMVHFAVYFATSILLLLPYCLLRPAMRPVGGRNGY
jgi:uncharacterized PurR-regulated membrane protein YhhQ (DUF165 family)